MVKEAKEKISLGIRIFKALSFWWKIFYLLVGILAIFLLCYILGVNYLEGVLKGGDTLYAYTWINYLDRWFPKVPLWFPYQGTGVSFTQGHPHLVFWIIILVHRLSELSLGQSTRLIGFLSVPLISTGIYFFVWVKLKNQTLALIAALFYPLSQASWAWLTDYGLYAQSVSIIFVMPTLLFYDLYLTEIFNKKNNIVRSRLFAILTALFFSMAIYSHTVTGSVLFGLLILYGILKSQYGIKIDNRLSKFWESLKSFIKIVLLTFGLSAFFVVSYYYYISIVSWEGLTFPKGVHLIAYHDIKGLLGILERPFQFFAYPVLVLSALGIIYAIFRQRVVAILGILVSFFTLFTMMPKIWPGIVEIFMNIWAALNTRAILVVMVLLPVVAAYGAYVLPDVLLTIISFLRRSFRKVKNTQKNLFFTLFKKGLISVSSLVIALLVVINFKHVPPGYSEKYNGLGPCCFNPSDKNPYFLTRNRDEIFEKIKNINISDDPNHEESNINEIVEKISATAYTRLDISPFLGRLVSAWNIYSDSSLIQIYGWGLSFLKGMFGYQVNVFYEKDKVSELAISNLSKWLGIEYLLLSKQFDPIDKFDNSDWKKIDEKEDFLIKEFSQKKGLVGWEKKPTVLVVSNLKEDGYMQVFRLANEGGMGYDEAFLIEGKNNVDDYSLSELKNFDVLFLYGYSYKNQRRAWKLLDDYVKGGGNLFIDTGWQYVSRDWETRKNAKLPDVFPFEALEWSNYGKDAKFEMNPEFAKDIDVNKFDPLLYHDDPWGISYPKGVKDWAKPILATKGNPIILYGEYGSGKIVWSGMNLVGHARREKNPEEHKFFNNIYKWLVSDFSENQSYQVEIKRDYPDIVELTLKDDVSGSWLLWREAGSPDWRVTLKSNGKQEKMKFYRAGPGLVFVNLPEVKEGDKLILEYTRNWKVTLGYVISIITFIIVLLVMFDLIFLKGRFNKAFSEKRIKIKLEKTRRKPEDKAEAWRKEEEDY